MSARVFLPTVAILNGLIAGVQAMLIVFLWFDGRHIIAIPVAFALACCVALFVSQILFIYRRV